MRQDTAKQALQWFRALRHDKLNLTAWDCWGANSLKIEESRTPPDERSVKTLQDALAPADFIQPLLGAL